MFISRKEYIQKHINNFKKLNTENKIKKSALIRFENLGKNKVKKKKKKTLKK